MGSPSWQGARPPAGFGRRPEGVFISTAAIMQAIEYDQIISPAKYRENTPGKGGCFL